MRRVALALALASTWAGVGAVAHAQADWTVRRDPFDRTVIARYKGILARTPHDRRALSELVSLYKHYRSVDLLVSEYEASLTEHESAATLVVLADLVRSRGDNKRGLALYTRAVVLAPDDSRSWLALGTLDRQAGDHKGARVAFEKAVSTATRAEDKKPALRELIVETTHDGDVIATEVAFADLVALSPRDGKLWMDRGDALADLRAFDLARTAYRNAEKLLGGDPERKLLAISAQGRLLERAGKLDDAIDEYDRAINASPPGFYIRRELALRILEIDKKRFPLDDVIESLERRWPRASRGAFEWKTFADLYKSAHRDEDMLHALKAAVRIEPHDVDAQWRLLRLVDAGEDMEEALAVLRAAVASNPTDLSLGIELAARMFENAEPTRGPVRISPRGSVSARDTRGARAILERLSRAYPRDADAHSQIAEVYVRMHEPMYALDEQRIVAKLDPTDDNIVALGDALLQAGEPVLALEAWERLLVHDDAASRARYASVLADHKFLDRAVDAYTKAMFSDDKNPKLWSGRALVFAALQDFTSAIPDAEHAASMIGRTGLDEGSDIRGAFVRVLDDADEPEAHIAAWTKAFGGRKPDIAAGYMLAAYFSRHPGPQLTTALTSLHRLVPADDGVLRELIRAQRLEHHFDEAIKLVHELAKKKPERATEMAELIHSIEVDRKRVAELETRDEQGDAKGDEPFDGAADDVEAPGALCRMYRCLTAEQPTSPGTTRRVPLVAGARLGIGVGLAGTTERTMTFGSGNAIPVTPTYDVIVRADWAQHIGEMRSVNALAAAAGLGRHGLVTSNTAWMVSSTLRAERRFGDPAMLGPWDRWGFAADVSLEVTTRALPATLGVRYEQAIADPARTSMLLFELSVGVRCLDVRRLSGGSGACR